MSAVRSSCGGNWRPASGVADKFPAGLRVLVVDDDPTCLLILERMLKRCLYEVTKCNRAEIALSLLRENKNGYDVVISDVHMPDMDGFKLLEHVGLEMDLPVIMMSADDNKAVVMKGVTHDACDYLIKPVRMDTLKNIWQHVVRKKKHEWKELEQSRSGEEVENRQPKQTEDADYSSSANEGSWRNSKRHKDEEEDLDDRDDTSTLKKPRVVWSIELHKQFVAAVNHLGIDKAVPKKILELMNVPGLTRENVASHLQKYRLYLTRISRGLTQQHLGVLSNGFMGSQDSGPFRNMSSLTGLDLHAMAVSGHLPAQSRPAPQSAAFIKGDASSGMVMPGIVQRNIFSFENPKFRFGEGQQLQQMTNGKEINLLHGIPANMESKQITNMHRSKSAFGSVNMQALQPQSEVSKIPLSIDLLNVPNGAGAVQMRNANPAHNTGSQSSPVASFSNNNSEFVGKSFPLASAPGIMPAKRMLHGQTHSRITGLIAYGSDLDKFNQIIQQQKNSHGWELAGARLQFDDSHRNLDVQRQKFSVGTTFNSGGAPAAYLGETANQRMVDHNSVKIKGERISFDPQNIFLPQEYDLEDLVSSHLKQHPGSNGPADEEFGFDGYPPISNILV